MPLEKKCTGTARLSQTSRKLQDKVHSHANIILLHWSVLGSFSTSLPAAREHLLVLGLQEAAVGGPKPVMAPIARHLYGLDLSHENSDSKALQCNLTQTNIQDIQGQVTTSSDWLKYQTYKTLKRSTTDWTSFATARCKKTSGLPNPKMEA